MTTETEPLTSLQEALSGIEQYYVSIGCSSVEGTRRRGYVGFSPMIQLPSSSDIWELDIDEGGNLLVTWYESRWTIRNQMCKKGRLFKVLLADPESLPKAFAHMQRYSRFLRGGTNHAILQAKAE